MISVPARAEAVAGITRAFWRLASDHEGTREEALVNVPATPESARAWAALVSAARQTDGDGVLWAKIESELRKKGWLIGPDATTGKLAIHPATMQPMRVLSLIVDGTGSGSGPGTAGGAVEDDYFLWQAIRCRWLTQKSTGSPGDTIRVLNAAVRALVRLVARHADAEGHRDQPPASSPPEISTAAGTAEVRECLRAAIAEEFSNAPQVDHHVEFFLECCRALRTVVHPYRPPGVWVEPEWLDADRILSHLVGLRTRIPFFDELFQGGGLAVATSQPNQGGDSLDNGGRRRGRIIVIRGRFGTGKTSLALALGAAVGRVGGVAWFTPLEQSPDQCLQYMRALGMVAPAEESQIEHVPPQADPNEVQQAIEARTQLEGGHLLIFRRRDQDILKLVDAIRAQAEQSAARLRLFILDPLNSVRFEKNHELRSKLVEGLERICETGANLLLTAEHDPDKAEPFDVLANIADTVIELSVRSKYDYEQRYVEVLKSRLQREQRGTHPIAIQPGTGLTVALSASSMTARLRARRVRTASFVCSFGLAALDELLGPRAMYQGDAIVLVGKTGTFKSLLGLSFLLGSDWQQRDLQPGALPSASAPAIPPSGLKPISLYIAVRDQFAVRRTIESEFNILNDPRAEQKEIKFLELPSGMVTTAWILRLLEQKFDEAQSEGKFIDRVLVSNLAHWELSCPFVRDDAVFGDVFSDFVRSRQATLLHICNDSIADRGSTLQRTILDDSNVQLEVRRVEYEGRDRVLLRVIKTRAMSHSRDAVEVSIQARGITLDPSLLRLDREGVSHKLSLDLFVYGDGKLQRPYYREIKKRLHAILDVGIRMNRSKDHRAALVRTLQSAPFLSGDGLRILQLDEFEVIQLRDEANASRPRLAKYPTLDAARHRPALLHSFPKAELAPSQEDVSDIDGALCEHAMDPDNANNLVAVPYYQNIALLCVARDQGQDDATFKSWAEIAKKCDEHATAPDPKLFFWMPVAVDEDLNCLFWEILLSTRRKLNDHREPCALPADGMKNVESFLDREVCNIFRSLCRPLVLGRQTTVGSALPDRELPAKVSRLWFSTLWEVAGPNASELPFSVLPLPGKASLTGEWYLAITASSPSLPVGLAVLRDLTSPEADAERYQQRIGLPIRKRFYDDSDGTASPMQGLIHGASIGELLKESYDKRYRRSVIRNYAKLAPIMGVQLRRLCQLGSHELTDSDFNAWLKQFANAVKVASRAGGSTSSPPTSLLPSEEGRKI